MCKWKPEYQPDYECKEPSLGGDPWGYCILHSENEAKDIKAFKEKVEERIATTGNRIDLIGCYFPSGFEAGFLRERRFEKPVDFREATFTEGAYFRGATFTQEANFFGATFTKGADFIGATFTQGEFIGTAFEGVACFDYTEFSERVSFRPGVSMEGEKQSVLLGPGSSFQYTRFPKEKEAVFQDVGLSNCSFLHSNIDKVDFRYCEFGNEPAPLPFLNYFIPRRWQHKRQNVLKDEIDADNDVGTALAAVRKRAGTSPAPTETEVRYEKYEPVRRLYLELKRNFEDKKDWNTAGDFHYGEMECRRKKMGWLGRNIFSLEAVYYWASGYGERPWRALLWWFLSTLLFFPLLYRFSEHDPFSTCVWDSVRVATFMKIGIPIEPESWGRIILTLQYFICPTLLALFALALRRKVKR